MKILIANTDYNAHYYINQGLAKAFLASGHTVSLWNVFNKPVNDAFDECDPDLFIGQTYNVTRSLFNAIAERPDMKVIMKGSDFGEIQSEIDLTKYPVLVINEEEKQAIAALKEQTGKPDFVFAHYTQEYMEKTHGYWRKIGVEPKSLLNAADVFDYTMQPKDITGLRPEWKSDICFVGGKWGYKSQTIDRWLLPLCSPAENYNIKIFGNQHWGISQYCGFLETKDVKKLFYSAKVCPNLSEPHSQVFGYDIVERPFKLLSCKSFCISDYVESMNDVFGDGLVMAKTPEEFKEKIDFFLKEENRELKEKITQTGYDRVINSHTYFHRAASIFENLNLPAEAANVLKTYEEVKVKLSL